MHRAGRPRNPGEESRAKCPPGEVTGYLKIGTPVFYENWAEEIVYKMAEKEENEVDLEKKSNCGILSKEGKFAYVRLCSKEMAYLYGQKQERLFVTQFICGLMKYLDLPRQEQSTLTRLLSCDLEGDQDIEEPFNNNNTLVNQLKKNCGTLQNLVCILQNLIIFALRTGNYDARHRVLIYSISEKLCISPDKIADVEDELVSQLHSCEQKEQSEEELKHQEKESLRKFKKGLLIGLGAIGGGALIGITGGLAAPLLAAGVGTLFGSSFAVALASVNGVAVIASLFGAAGAGLTGQKLNRRLGNIEQFEFEKTTQGEHLNVLITVSGWLENTEENAIELCGFQEPWKKLTMTGSEQYCLKWESKYLTELGSAISFFLTSSVLGFAAEEAVKHTVLSSLVSAVAWPLAILKVGYIIDNPWGVCASRSAEVGKQLANVLIEKHHGHRPVTLVGFSFGARVIFHCLKALVAIKGSAGIIQDVIMVGSPVTGDPVQWRELDRVVAGKIFNCYSRKDWLLRFVYRTASAQGSVAGLKPVLWKNRRMFNVNLVNIVKSHTDYCNPDKMLEIMKAVSSDSVCVMDDNTSSCGEESRGNAFITVKVPTQTLTPINMDIPHAILCQSQDNCKENPPKQEEETLTIK